MTTLFLLLELHTQYCKPNTCSVRYTVRSTWRLLIQGNQFSRCENLFRNSIHCTLYSPLFVSGHIPIAHLSTVLSTPLWLLISPFITIGLFIVILWVFCRHVGLNMQLFKHSVINVKFSPTMSFSNQSACANCANILSIPYYLYSFKNGLSLKVSI